MRLWAPSRRSQIVRTPFVAAVLSFLTVLCLSSLGCNGGSRGTKTPTNLQYAQPTIAAVQGIAIATDMPAVTGTVAGFTVSPALPAGLSLNPSTGAISGTPTAVTSSATYAVTASNSAGSATTTLTISVAPTAPSELSYSQTTINATVGTAIATDTPTITGTVASYAVSPALPLGLSLNAATGAISGTPGGPSAQASYTVTASNSTGSTTAQLSITVTQTSSVLLELGHGATLASLRTAGDRVLSEDATGHWNLWDYVTGNIVKNGDGALTQPTSNLALVTGQIDLAGQAAVVQTSGGINVLSASDGSSLSTIPAAAWWKLASDGSYICTGSVSGLTVYSTSGQVVLTHPGDYHAAMPFAAPGQVQIALGAAGANAVETLAVPAGTSTLSPPFTGTFYAWFLDGEHFLTTVGNTAFAYSPAGVQQGVIALPSIQNLTGQGNWISIETSANGGLQVYAIGSNTPALTLTTYTHGDPSGMLIAIPNFDSDGLSIVDLSGASPVVTNFTGLTPTIGTTFASSNSSQWLIDTGSGAILDGATLAGPNLRTLGYGQIQSIAATPNVVALATSAGKILLMDPAGPTLQSTLKFEVAYPSSQTLAISSDGSVLGALRTLDSTVCLYPELNFYSLPSLNVISSYSYPCNDYIEDFDLSGSGQIIGITEGNPSTTSQVTGITGTPVIWSIQPGDSTLRLSPDGTLLAATSSEPGNSTAIIYQNGNLVTAVQGFPGGWIDNGHLFVPTYQLGQMGQYVYSGTTIYSPSGATLATFPSNTIPEILEPQFPSSNLVFNPNNPAVYSLTDGSLVWTAPSGVGPTYGVAAVSGSNAVVQVAHQVLLYPY